MVRVPDLRRKRKGCRRNPTVVPLSPSASGSATTASMSDTSTGWATTECSSEDEAYKPFKGTNKFAGLFPRRNQVFQVYNVSVELKPKASDSKLKVPTPLGSPISVASHSHSIEALMDPRPLVDPNDTDDLHSSLFSEDGSVIMDKLVERELAKLKRHGDIHTFDTFDSSSTSGSVASHHTLRDREEAARARVRDLGPVTLQQKYVKKKRAILRGIKFVVCCRCICRKKVKAEEEPELKDLGESEENLTWQYVPRTDNSSAYITGLYKHAQGCRIPKGRDLCFRCRTTALKVATQVLSHLDRGLMFTTQARAALGFSVIYFDSPLTVEQQELSKGRSIVGSYLWLITFSLRLLHIIPEEEKDVYEELADFYDSLLQDSLLIWSGICHMVETACRLLTRLEYSIEANIVTQKPFTKDLYPKPKVHLGVKGNQKQRRRWRRRKRRADRRMLRAKTQWPLDAEYPKEPALNLLARWEGTGHDWHDFVGLTWKDQIQVILVLGEKLTAVFKETMWMLEELDKELHVLKPNKRLNEANSIYEATHVIRHCFHKFKAFPYSMLKEEEVDEFDEVGRILLDKTDEIVMELYALKDIGRETRHMVQLCYEFAREYHGMNVLPYYSRAKHIHQGFMESWAHNDSFDASEKIYHIREPIPLFNASVYQVLLQIMPVKVMRLLLGVEEQDDIWSPTKSRLATKVPTQVRRVARHESETSLLRVPEALDSDLRIKEDPEELKKERRELRRKAHEEEERLKREGPPS